MAGRGDRIDTIVGGESAALRSEFGIAVARTVGEPTGGVGDGNDEGSATVLRRVYGTQRRGVPCTFRVADRLRAHITIAESRR